MSTLLTNIGTILSNLLTWLSQVAGYLITNPIFLILLAIGVFVLLFNYIKTLVGHIKWNKKYGNMNEWDLWDFDQDKINWIKEHDAYYNEVIGEWVGRK